MRAKVAAGTFREDLLYRLEVVTVEVPALRHRTDDIPPLVLHFLAKSKTRNPDSVVERFSKDAMRKLLAHSWPCNVRELEHLVERMVVLARGEEVQAAELPATMGREALASSMDLGSSCRSSMREDAAKIRRVAYC